MQRQRRELSPLAAGGSTKSTGQEACFKIGAAAICSSRTPTAPRLDSSGQEEGLPEAQTGWRCRKKKARERERRRRCSQCAGGTVNERHNRPKRGGEGRKSRKLDTV
jgi:hypothetical protein